MSSGSATLKFEIYKDGELLRTEALSQDIIKVGKLPSSHLRLDDPNVSRIHAVIERSADGEVYIVDLGSAKGTLVNGQKVNKCKLSSGDELTLGGLTLRFTLESAAAPAEAPTRADMTASALAAGAFGGGFEEATHVGAAPSEAPTRADLSASSLAAGASALQPLPTTPSPSNPFEAATRAAPAPAPAPMAAAPVAAAPVAAPRAAAAAPAASVQAQGWYDDQGNWHDGTGGYYDPQGLYHDAEGGWYDADGYYHDGQGGMYDPEGNYYAEGAAEPELPKDIEIYTESFLEKNYDGSGGGVLEVALLWSDHVLAVNQYPRSGRVTIGEAKGADFPIKDDALPEGGLFPLISPEGQDAALNFTERMKGMVYIDDRRYTLTEAVREGIARQGGFGKGSFQLQLTSRTRARVDVGESTFLIHYGEREKGLPFGGGFSFDVALLGFFSLSAAVHILFMFLAFFIPPKSQSFGLDGFDVNNRFVQAMVKPEEEQKEEEEPEWLKNKDQKEPEEAGAKAKGDEGAAGDRQSDQKNKKMGVKGDASNTEVKIAKDREVAYNSGALSVLGNSQISASWGSGSTTSGFDPITAMGDNKGSSYGAAYGFGAFGTAGTGRGGGGVSENSIGTGGFGTRGRGGEGGEGGAGYGRDAGDLEERATRVPQVVPGTPTITGSLDKELIRRVIRKHRNEVKYCYEQELIKNKSLAGKVVVQFTISSTGSVVAAVSESSTLNNPNVERCIAGKVRRWIFPEPKGGGIVIVKYPFVFAPQ